MSNLTHHQNQQHTLQELKAMAAVAMNSGKYNGSDYNEATLINIFLTAKALGIEPMVALNGGFNIIKGKINMGAHFMTALVRRQGHSLKVIEMTDKKCVIIGQRKDNGDSVKYEYTWEEAVRAKLTNKQNWTDNPKNMLYCACVRNVFRVLFSDLGIAYDADEMNIESFEQEEATHVEVSAPSIAMVAAQEAAAASDEDDYQRLRDALEKDSIALDHFDDYLNDLSAKHNRAVDKVVQSALNPNYLTKFKNAYLKFVEKIQTSSEQPLAV